MSQMRQINKIIIHCTATPEGQNVTTEQIRRYHMHDRQFADIGYHFVIELDGSVHIGRPIDRQGAHCFGYNQDSIGIAYVGGLDKNGNSKDTRTPEQKASLIALVKKLKAQYPHATVHGHNEFAKKDCPCFNVQKSELCAL